MADLTVSKITSRAGVSHHVEQWLPCEIFFQVAPLEKLNSVLLC